jgi:predicted MFS family arabinose efflux permease
VRTLAANGLAARVALSLVATAGFFYVNIMPAIVQGLVDALGLSQREAGLVGSANLYGASCGALLAVLLVQRLPWRAAARALLLALIVADAASALLASAPALIGLRFVHGVLAGTLVGVMYAVMARTGEPDRTFGVLLFVQFGLGGLGVLVLPALVPQYGSALLFGVLVAFSAVAIVLLPLLAPYPAPPVPERRQAQAGSRVGMPLLLTLLAIFLFQAGNMALFPYVIGLGEAAGLERGFVTPALAASSWIGLAGAALVVWLGTRHGRLWPLLTAILLTALGNGALLFSRYAEVYLLANLGVGLTWAFVMPYLLGMCAALDPGGRLAALGGLASKLGLATGPLVAALLIGGQDYARVIVCSVLALAGCLLAVAMPAAELDRAMRKG